MGDFDVTFGRTRFKGGIGRQFGGKRRKPGEMTKPEQRYSDLLEARKRAGEIVEWWFEAFTFKLADGTRFTPDFFVTFPDGSAELVDVKGTGPVDDKSVVKVKVAADRFWMFRFVVEKERRVKDGGGFERKEF